ncbi:MAG: LytTR family DNA-binding domain-containing protein [Polaribacter sp.]|uniref:LytTR family transcriptional regulator DNA-binding domain-containing protein n=1 Tax=Polaribacter sp. TaxID=1920175 RepID=UPI003BB1288F
MSLKKSISPKSIFLFAKRNKLYLEFILILISSYYFFAIGKGGAFLFHWKTEYTTNIIYTLFMVVSSWYLFKKLNRVLKKKEHSSLTVLQVITSIGVLIVYSQLFNWIYIEIILRVNLTSTVFFALILPPALITFSVWHIIYFVYCEFSNSLIQVDKKLNEKEAINQSKIKQQLISSIGKKKKLIPIDQIAFICTQDACVYACSFNDQSFLLDDYLNNIEKQLDEALFFRLNRQIIIAKKAITHFQSESNQKIKVFFCKVNGFEDSAIVSRYKSPQFKAWMKT